MASAPDRRRRRLSLDGEICSADLAANPLYSEAAVSQRLALFEQGDVRAALDQLWSIANYRAEGDDEAFIDRDEYFTMHRKIVLALSPDMAPSEVRRGRGGASVGAAEWSTRSSQGVR